MSLSQIFLGLNEKLRNKSIAKDPNNKYKRALDKINELLSNPGNTLDDISNALTSIIDYKNGKITGGKTRRRRRNRTKKMRGGFKYSVHAKRRGLTTFSKRSSYRNSTSSIRSPRRSSTSR